MPPPSVIPQNRRRKANPQPIAPGPAPNSLKHFNAQHHVQQSSPSASISSLSVDQEDDDEEYSPRHAAGPSNATRRTASSTGITNGAVNGKRKQPPTAAGTQKSTKMSREALRKANHSLIERRRREKINAALGELRRMVPGLAEDGGKAGEFKLEVLERTVAHMKDLKNHIVHLESIIADHGIDVPSLDGSSTPNEDDDADDKDQQRLADDSMYKADIDRLDNVIPQGSANPYQHTANHQGFTRDSHPPSYAHFIAKSETITHSQSPYPSPRPEHEVLGETDPNETEPETNLPPPLTKASRIVSRQPSPPIATPSVASLLAQATHSNSPTPPPPVSRPAPPPQSSNPIFLPFPAPSPTSPFLNGASNTISSSGSSTSSMLDTSRSYMSDPSPFLAPISGMSLFGGVLNLEQPSPADSMRILNNLGSGRYSPPSLALPPSNTKEKLKDMPPEEAANLLLAFSSPDTMRPQTQVNIPSQPGTGRDRRLTLENDDFRLDTFISKSNSNSSNDEREVAVHKYNGVLQEGSKGMTRGKSAMDFLQMSETSH
ncbi:uncharacterized protein I303_108006 [Kwoniella dejecticola CBS 10117]|uniref:BHLH domain-containing protein n=1 Tax=Kwoniella dejecticola CBS 10117 TaxID=1296121 RepID=A0A1A5ZWA2_9TREE|nr:uncharacterized protein I303_07997 [Kwoniella dejecticola CBS 10117]OBR82083.1 hypothetical protein I303_07997 [Kwoniella dejecticola CBS 10117]